MIYEPREDSLLLKKHISRYARGNVLDMGTGSGLLAEEAARSNKVKKVVAVDIQKKIIAHCKNNIKNKKIVFRQSDLFKNINESFDLIIFNPPYLPRDTSYPDVALDGGKIGYEIIARFLKQAKKHLTDKGKILLVFSSFTNQEKVDEHLKKNGFVAKCITNKDIFFEDIFLYIISKKHLKQE